jgi:hypothetical protein
VSVADSLTPREQDVVRTLVRLADTMDADFELAGAMAELTRDCVRLLGVTAAGLLLAGPRGRLAVVAASSAESHALEVAQLEVGEGPGIDCYRTGLHVAAGDLGSTGGRWPNLAATAAGSNFRTAYTFPMRLRRDVIGSLTLFSTDAANSLRWWWISGKHWPTWRRSRSCASARSSRPPTWLHSSRPR